MSVVFFPGHRQEMTLVLWEQLCTLHRQNSLNQVTLSLPASGPAQRTFQEQEDDLCCLPHSLFFLGQSFQPIPEEVRHTLSGISAQNSPFPCWSTNHSYLTSPKLNGWAEISVFSLVHSCLIFPAHIISFNPVCLSDSSCPLCRHRGHEVMSNYLWIFC